MEALQGRGRGHKTGVARRPQHRNKQWIAPGQEHSAHSNDGERWERGGHPRSRGRGRGFTPHSASPQLAQEDGASGTEDEEQENANGMDEDEDESHLDTPEERDKFWQRLVKEREAERKRAIAEGKMDDPNVRKRLEDAITLVGTCLDMCPRFERYRRERENNLDKWEVIPGTKRVDHKRAVKIYERAAGDKTLPSDLRPPEVLKKTLDYLFRDLIQNGFAETHAFIRDRIRAIKQDFVIQQSMGRIAIESYDRIARYHILAIHLLRETEGFDPALEEQQLMYTLTSLKECWEHEQGRYTADTEMEMRVYHRLIHMRDEKSTHDPIREEIASHPVFQLTTRFRKVVQQASQPIRKTSRLIANAEAMQIFGELANRLREQNNVVMIYLVACILERVFGKDTIDNIEAIRGDLSYSDIIDGKSKPLPAIEAPKQAQPATTITRSATEWLSTNFGTPPPPSSAFAQLTEQKVSPAPPPANTPPPQSAFSNLTTRPNPFGGATSAFGGPTFSVTPSSSSTPQSAFATTPSTFASTSPPKPEAQPVLFSSSSPFSTSSSTSTFAGATTSSSPFAAATSTATSGSDAQPSTSFNPTAPAFVPLSKQLFVTTSLGTPPQPQPSPPNEGLPPATSTPPPFLQPSPVQPSNVFPQTAVPPTATTIDKAPSIAQPSISAATTQSSTPPRIVERRQTLWEIPSSSPSRAETPAFTQHPMVSEPEPMPMSPVEPPPVRVQPMPLPPTPTARWFDPSSLPTPIDTSGRKRSIVNLYHLQMPDASPSSPTGMLSPLRFGSSGSLGSGSFPTGLDSRLSSGLLGLTSQPQGSPTPDNRPTSSPLVQFSLESPTTKKVNVAPNGTPSRKGKEKERADMAELNELALKFMRRSLTVKTAFHRWLKKAIDKAAWEEACRRSEAYQEQIRRERLSSSVSVRPTRRASPPKRRRASLDGIVDSAQSKRKRRRTLGDHKPLNDDELAKQLQLNHEENQKRWTRGSFLKSIRDSLSAKMDPQAIAELDIWLSLNGENDSTAIWLEHKFALPDSGRWLSENIFSIAASPGASSSTSSPGVIVFERSPLGEVEDPIERKYRILDDCARLRDIIEEYHRLVDPLFQPSLVLIRWADDDRSDIAPDYTDMVRQLQQENVLGATYTFTIASRDTDLDNKFDNFLTQLKVLYNEENTHSVTWDDIMHLFVEPFKQHASDWLDSVWVDEILDWGRYGDVIRAVEEAQNLVVDGIAGLLSLDVTDVHVDPPAGLKAPPHLERAYATGSLPDLYANAAVEAIRRATVLKPHYRLLRRDIMQAQADLSEGLESLSERLRELAAIAAESTIGDTSPSISIDISPSATPNGTVHDVGTATMSETSAVPTDTTGIPSSRTATSIASTTDTTDSSGKPVVTVAMLRALAQNILKSR
ncbi:hypothetical protein K474DRAFT_1664883 [Panus rudis PR-1116 ss-1]|nr:hypothetical protein K474DRAFT_1664883 [Panus rudis PR-1116 ss-1]